MKQNLLFVALLSGAVSFAQDCSDIFISEYVEGWSNNKALELYNPTANTIDLSQYMVIRYSNGATSATSSNAIQLTGTVASHDVYVATLDKRDPMGTGQEAPVWDELQAKTDGYYCPVYATNDAFYWNGNDAIVLAKGSPSNINGAQLIDVFGRVGENPGSGSDPLNGWSTLFPYTSGNGDGVSVDHSMIRKATILKGRTNPTAIFDPLAEWDSIPAVIDNGMGTLVGNWNSLGVHNCNCGPASVVENVKPSIEIYPNPTTGKFIVTNANAFESMVIVNAIGQQVASFNELNMIHEVELDGRKGVYFVTLTDASGDKVTKRVILK